ncbi:substrate-binding periplasmic protein [Sapientia aquatica]|uniref:ABC transporter substrate-binding protein n=1 Tax=Sapientia aquatica TaxID=1549640 RepID=A0A4R5VY38_9BURK|nr:ABC transporter substrate-binding protein [Sapientia aquatica]TDK64410.1 ABC transporter substrate-binding protein [Sapientia aquatica]
MFDFLTWHSRQLIFASLIFGGSSIFTPTLAQNSIPVYVGEVLDIHGRPAEVSRDINEFVRYLESETGLSLKIVVLPWNRAKEYAKNGQGFLFGFSKSPERIIDYDFSEPFWVEKIWLISAGKKQVKVHSPKDLLGQIIGVERGASYGFEFEAAKATIFKVDDDTLSMERRFQKLFSGRNNGMLWIGRRLDSEFDSGAELKAYLIKNLFPTFSDQHIAAQEFTVAYTPIFFDTIHFACAKGKYQGEMTKISKAIEHGKRSGRIKLIFTNSKANLN